LILNRIINNSEIVTDRITTENIHGYNSNIKTIMDDTITTGEYQWIK